MKFVQILFKFYVYSNLHVSLAVASLVLVNGTVFHKNVGKEAVFLSCATFVAYHFIRYFNRFRYGKEHLLDRFSNQYKKVLMTLVLIACFIEIGLLFFLKTVQLLKLIPFGCITILYACHFFKIRGVRYSLRYLSILKIFLIGWVWAGVTVFFITDFNVTSGLYFLELMLFVIALTIPFDIRDVDFDKGRVKTLPIYLGILNTKYLAGVFLLISVVLHIQFVKQDIAIFMLISGWLLGMICYAKKNQANYFASFWVEGIPIVWYLGIYLT